MPSIEISVETLRRNSTHRRDIAILQAFLAQLGFLGWEIDGVFGPVTERGVRAFQAQAGLKQDGVVGPITWGRLAGSIEPAAADPQPAILPSTLQPEDLDDAAKALNVDKATIRAICEVEASGSGFLPSGRPKILFEGHVFWAELLRVNLNPRDFLPANRDILYQKWTKEHYLGGTGEYTRLKRAMEIHEAAALKSASWGLFQIMGFNHAVCGFETVHTFVSAMYESERRHLLAFCSYVLLTAHDGKPLVQYLREKNWAGFARGYNGPGYKVNGYDVKLASAYKRCSAA